MASTQHRRHMSDRGQQVSVITDGFSPSVTFVQTMWDLRCWCWLIQGLHIHNKQPYLINSHISRVPSHVLWKLLWLLSGSQGRHGWVSRNWSVSPKFYVIHCGASTHHNILTTVMTSPGNAHTCPGSSPYGSVQNRSSLSGFMRELVCLCNFRNKVVTSC